MLAGDEASFCSPLLEQRQGPELGIYVLQLSSMTRAPWRRVFAALGQRSQGGAEGPPNL